MAQHAPTVAVLSESPALASILAATLRHRSEWRVREFRTAEALAIYMRIAPTAMVVCDYRLGETTAAEFAGALREDREIVSRHCQIIAMTREIDPGMRVRCVAAGIDEVIVKPMSPRYLEERVAARLRAGPVEHIATEGAYAGPERRDRIVTDDPREVPHERRGKNIVSFLAHKASREMGHSGPDLD